MNSIFDPKNPRHIEILREELKYVKQLMQEESGLTSRDVQVYIRGIRNMISDENRFSNTIEVRDLLKNELNTTDNEVDSIITALQALSTYNASAVPQINTRVQKLLKHVNPTNSVTSTHGTTSSTDPNWRGGWRGGKWTGD